MITYEEAKNIAITLRTNLDWCAEFKNGYVFSSVYDEGYVGGLDHSPIVVLKSTGEIVTMMRFVNSGTGKMLREGPMTEFEQ